ncbi:MAG: nickel-dependent hydrogenase large subunit [Acidobacteriota bacterium]
MSKDIRLHVPLNRVEGDLDIKVDLRDGRVADAWSSGTMYRGFENILVGRAPLDGLVISPRICGICTTAHLTVAARALDKIAGTTVPDNARRLRNVTLMAEHIQSDIRHAFLLFAPDFANPAHASQALHAEAVRRYEPFKGRAAIETIKETKRVIEIIGILGGQWPHSSFMVPGGVVGVPATSDLLQCRQILALYRQWYEQRVLGCRIERWQAVHNLETLEAWLDECDSHRASELGFFLRFGRAVGLDTVGRGHGNYVCFGSLELPEETSVRPGGGPAAGNLLQPAGFARGTVVESFDQAKISEHVAHSWFRDYGGGRHPSAGETNPYATGSESHRYSWAKAPRYDGAPAETGPLAEMIIAGHPLISDWVGRLGPSALVRELARLIRPTTLMPAMDTWIAEMLSSDGEYYRRHEEIEHGEGCGLGEAARGALGHWVTIRDGKIDHYQIITPTAWNGSPRDSNGIRGPWEEALIGTPVRDPENPVELGHVVRSFDPCLVCTVHTVSCRRDAAQLLARI